MKKSSTFARNTADGSLYRYFSNLPHHIANCGIALNKDVPTGPADFTEAMKGVRKINQEKKIIRKKPSPQRAFGGQQEQKIKENLVQAIGNDEYFNVTNLPEYMEGYIESIHPFTLEKIRKGEFSVEKILDLHGCSTDNASKIFSQFIQDAVKSGLRCVKIIHGRGLKSRGTPVLKENIKHWIIRAMNRKWVVAFSSSKMSDGGPGATYILLRQRPAKKKIHILG